MAPRNSASPDRTGAAVALAIVVPAVCIGFWFAWPLLKLDGSGALRTVLFANGIEYAPGYTHRRFAKLELGMTRAQVTELLGEPLNKNESKGRGFWSHARRGKQPATWSRIVVFGGEVVVELPGEYAP